MRGFLAAKHVVNGGRGAIFSGAEVDLPHRDRLTDLEDDDHPDLEDDDRTPQFGFVGAKYPSTGVLLLGINPGNGPRDRRSQDDKSMMPHLKNFRQNPTEQNFQSAMQSYMDVCDGFGFWVHCRDVMDSGGLSRDDIAYSNCLPWRTESGTKFGKQVAERTAELYVRPLIEELEPRLIVALGKMRVPEILSMADPSPSPSFERVVWNCARVANEKVMRERDSAAERIIAIVRPDGRG
jgi:hypothetical protein